MVAVVLTLNACGSFAYHRVEQGETLYSIGWEYGYDHQILAQWNDIDPPYVIRPGQWLRIMPPAGAGSTLQKTRQQQAQRSPGQRPGSSRAANTDPRLPENPVTWVWPAQGKLLAKFSRTHAGKQGLDIAGRMGAPVRAAAAGRVVYSGSGLIGYGNLVIIKHNERYLSAYGHNRRLLVKEGDHVTRGQPIAEMGNAGAERVKLHFEIRRDGKPVDPMRHLPTLRSSR